MKICIVSRGDIPIFPANQGASVKLYSTIKFLSLMGHDVYFVTSESSSYLHAKDGHFEEKKYPRWLANFLPYGRLRRNLSLWLGIPKEDVVLYKPLLDVALWLKTLYVVKKEKADVVQAEFPAFAIPAAVAKLAAGVPALLVEHNIEYLRISETSDPSSLGRRLLKFVETSACRASNAIVTTTEEDKKRLGTIGADSRKIFVIPHGVDLEEYAHVNGQKIRKLYKLNGTVLVFHGVLIYPPNLDAVKTIAEKILPKLNEIGLNAKALVIGDYPPAGIKHPDLIFTGAVKDLPDYIAAADIAVVPLISGGGMRMKILEYFAAKKPVISTPKGAEGIPVSDGKEIILADIADFPKHILKLAKSEKLREKIAENAFSFVQGNDWRKICDKYVEIYKNLLNTT
jgi:glycosyltransferase involved in cell wall biosynthesis